MRLDDAANRCDWADGTQCQLRGVQIEEENMEEEVEELSEVVLGRCEAGTYTPVQGDCTAFYQCVEGERMMKHCADGLHWNKNKNVRSLLLTVQTILSPLVRFVIGKR